MSTNNAKVEKPWTEGRKHMAAKSASFKMNSWNGTKTITHHWLQSHPIANSSCKGSWEMQQFFVGSIVTLSRIGV